MTTNFGVDGCRGGWLRVGRKGNGELAPPALFPDAAALLRELGPKAHLGVDMPIGLPEQGARTCDREARTFLGRPRGSSVFPAPIRAQLAASDHADAVRVGRAADGRGLTIQTWNILPKIRDLDAALRAHPADQDRVHEVHPEVSFALWAGAPLTDGKRSPEGREQRRALVEEGFGKAAIEAARKLAPKKLLADDDILDAFAVLWSTERIARGASQSFPAHAEQDACGLRMCIEG